MKYIFTQILLIVICFQLFGQSDFVINGKVVDFESKNSLPYATVAYKNKSLGTVTNTDGLFNLSISAVPETDSITVSHIGYKTISRVISDCIINPTFELESDILELNQVTIIGEEFNLNSFIKKVVKDYNRNRKNNPHIAIAHYREKAKIEDKYIMYMESIGYSIFSGILANVAPLSNYNFFPENTKSHVVHSSWVKYRENIPRSENVPPACGSTLNVFRSFEISGFLSNKEYKNYRYSLDSTYFINNQPIHIISFQGNKDKGSFEVFENSKQLLKIEFSSNMFWSTAFHKRLKAQVKFRFNYFNETPYISFIEANYQHKGLHHFNTLTVLLQKFNDFKFNKDEYWSINDYNGNPYIDFNSEAWKTYNVIEDPDYVNVKSDLKSEEISLEEQFLLYSGRWFFLNNKGSELAKTKINELKVNF